MVRAGFCCELYHFRREVCDSKRDEFYLELFKLLDFSTIPEGTAVVSIREVTHKNYYRRGLMKYGLIERAKHLVSKGLIWDYIWTSSPVSHKANL